MADTEKTSTSEKKSTNPLVFVGVGCLVLLVVLGIAGSIIMKFFAKRVGMGILSNVIESKTGVKTNISDLEQGKMTFTDNKTGEKVDIGTGKIPDTFPKEFPVYPGTKVTSSLSGAASGKNNGFWLTLSTADSVDKVSGWYKDQLAKNGWKIESNYTANDTMTEAVTKTGWSGSLAITGSSGKETQIVIILGQDTTTPEPTDTPDEGANQ
jgi:hypothetical protein